MQYIKRDLERVVLQASEEYPAVIIPGSRQIGKTTMLQKLMQGTTRNYVTLDDLTERALAQNDPEMFLQLHKPPILIDEVQYAPQLFTYIKIHADRNQRPGDFWMTGSQPFKLMKLVGESLVGRACILHMCTMSQNELYGNGENLPFTLNQDTLQMRIAARTPADTPAIYERIFRGSMPALASGHVSNRNLFYSSYLQTYIERDIRELDGDIESVEFLRFITAVACRTGSRWSTMLTLATTWVECVLKRYRNGLGCWKNPISFFICIPIPTTCLNVQSANQSCISTIRDLSRT